MHFDSHSVVTELLWLYLILTLIFFVIDLIERESICHWLVPLLSPSIYQLKLFFRQTGVLESYNYIE